MSRLVVRRLAALDPHPRLYRIRGPLYFGFGFRLRGFNYQVAWRGPKYRHLRKQGW